MTSPASKLPQRPAVQAIAPVQFTAEDMKNPALLNTILPQLINAVNSVLGVGGPAKLAGGVDVAGQQVTNLGQPRAETDAVSLAHAEGNYSAAALAPRLEAGGSHTLKTFRALNSKQQSEKFSTFLNQVSNTAPTTNTTIVVADGPVAGTVTVTIPAGYHNRVDGTVQAFGTFVFTVPTPMSFGVTSLLRSAGVVTATGTFSGLFVGESIFEFGAGDPSFDGTFILTSASTTTLQWSQPNQTDVIVPVTGGTVSNGGCFYAYLRFPSQQLAISGPFSDDTQLNRLVSNADGQVLIAVVVINGDGVVETQSAAGATIPVAENNGNRILARL